MLPRGQALLPATLSRSTIRKQESVVKKKFAKYANPTQFITKNGFIRQTKDTMLGFVLWKR